MTLLLTALFFSQLYAVSSQSIRGGNAAVHQKQSVERKRQRKAWGSLFDTRIIGGSEANEGRYSFAVSMQDRIGHFCGGSLIAPDVVLSAAHCQGGEYSAVIGRHDLRTNDGDEIDVATELPHPDYDSYSTNNDFMLLFLSRPTTETVDFAKISPDVTSVGESVTVMGWGDTHISDTISELADELMEVEVKTISNNACEASSGKIGGWDETYNGQITENMMCAEESNRAEDACQGDSGGPLVMHTDSGDYQVGVVSWGIGCAHADFPGVYARVSSQYNWIQDEVCKRSSDPPSYLQCGGSSSGSVIETDDSVSVTDDATDDAPNSSGVDPDFVNGNWRSIVSEDFKGGMGQFRGGGKGTKHYVSAKGRSGVVRIQESSSFELNEHKLDKNYSKIKVDFSFYALQFDTDDQFCLDFSTDGESNWTEQECWSVFDFTNKRWYDKTSVVFDAPNANTLKIRFRCDGDSKHDDVLFDDIEIQAA